MRAPAAHGQRRSATTNSVTQACVDASARGEDHQTAQLAGRPVAPPLVTDSFSASACSAIARRARERSRTKRSGSRGYSSPDARRRRRSPRSRRRTAPRPHHAHRRLARRVRRRLDAFDEPHADRSVVRLGGGGAAPARRPRPRSRTYARPSSAPRNLSAVLRIAADRTGRSTLDRPPPPPRPRRRRLRRAAAGANPERDARRRRQAAAAAASGIPTTSGTPHRIGQRRVNRQPKRRRLLQPRVRPHGGELRRAKRMVAAARQVVKVSHVLYQRHQRHAELPGRGRAGWVERRSGACVAWECACVGRAHRNMAMPLRTSTSDNRCGVVTTTAAVSQRALAKGELDVAGSGRQVD